MGIYYIMKSNNCNVILGIGNSMRGDDGAGSFVANNFKHPQWITIDGKSAPENFTSIIKRIKPQLLIIIDAAWMGINAGDFILIPPNKIISLQLSTHSMPISFLIEYLSPYCSKIIMIGIQPLNTQLNENLSKPVLNGCRLLIEHLKNNRLENLKIL